MREKFTAELADLKLQVEVMTLRVEEALSCAQKVLHDADTEAADAVAARDDDIDAMAVSLTERCHQLLLLESPVAGDLRLVLSVIRTVAELERMGDLCLRVAKTIEDQALLRQHPALYQVLLELSASVGDRFHTIRRAWAAEDVEALAPLDQAPPLETFALPLMSHIVELEGPSAARVAVAAITVGRALDRIGDHTGILAARLRYLLTGDVSHLAEEVL